MANVFTQKLSMGELLLPRITSELLMTEQQGSLTLGCTAPEPRLRKPKVLCVLPARACVCVWWASVTLRHASARR